MHPGVLGAAGGHPSTQGVRIQQSQTIGQEELGFFPVTHLANTAPPLPACLFSGPHPALERGCPAPLQSWSRGCRCLRQ